MTVVLASSGSLLLAQITFQSYLLGQMGATGEPYGSVLGNCEYSVTTIRWIILCSEVVRIKCSIIKVKRAFFDTTVIKFGMHVRIATRLALT